MHSITLKFGDDFTINTIDIPGTGMEYLLRYGYSQAMQDVNAGTAKEVRDAAKASLMVGADGKVDAKALAKWKRLVEAGGLAMAMVYADDESDVARVVTALEQAKRNTRFAAIAAGSMIFAAGGGKRVDPVTARAWIIAESELLAAYAKAKAKGQAVKQPAKASKDWDALVDRYVEKHEARLQDAARVAIAAEKAVDVDLDDLA